MDDSKRDARITVYNEVIAYLEGEECSYDDRDIRDAREWLRRKLDRECNRWLERFRVKGMIRP